MYLTPERFKTMGFGVDLEDVEDVTIRSAIARASAQIDAVCAVPRLPQKYDFRGGRMTDEAHQWVIDPYERPHPYQFWPWSSPILVIEDFAIFATNDIKIEIDPANIFINNSAGYVELSSLNLTEFGIFGAGLVPLLGLYNPIAKMTYTYGHRFAVVDEVADTVDAQTYQTQNGFWADDAVTVKVDGVTKTLTTDYTVDRTEGRAVFLTNQSADALVTISYTYREPWEIAQACGLLAADDLGVAELREKGMTGVASLRVQSGGGASVEIRRDSRSQRTGGTQMDELSGEVGRLLSGFVFMTAR